MSDQNEPAMKGFILQGLWQDLHELLREGRLDREAVEAFLDGAELEILDSKVEPTLWYPNQTYLRFAELIGRGVESADEAYWIERGRRAAARLMADGSVVDRMVEGVRAYGERAGLFLMKLPSLIFSYGRWDIEIGENPADFAVHVRDAESLPESLRLSLQGAGELVAERITNSRSQVTSSRPSLDHVIFEGRAI